MRRKFKQPPRIKAARAAGYAAWRARDEAARLAIPPAPPDPVAGQPLQWWTLAGRGWSHDVRLLVPADRGCRRPRSDQYDLEIDGAVVLRWAGITAIHDLLRTRYIPAQMTRQQRWTADCQASCANQEMLHN